VVVDPAAPRPGSAATRVFFGATVTYKDAAGLEHVVSIVGIDEVDLDRGYISWRSPLANALMKASPGDHVDLRAPAKTEHLEIIEVEYAPIPMDPFREPLGAQSTPPRSNALRLSRRTLSVPPIFVVFAHCVVRSWTANTCSRTSSRTSRFFESHARRRRRKAPRRQIRHQARHRTHKYKADDKGNETEVPLDDWIEIGAFAKPEKGEEVRQDILLASACISPQRIHANIHRGRNCPTSWRRSLPSLNRSRT